MRDKKNVRQKLFLGFKRKGGGYSFCLLQWVCLSLPWERSGMCWDGHPHSLANTLLVAAHKGVTHSFQTARVAFSQLEQ